MDGFCYVELSSDWTVPAVCSRALTRWSGLTEGCDWLDMLGSVKKIILGHRQPSCPLSDSAPCPRPQRRPPSTPPLPLRTMQLVAKEPERLVVLRDHRKVKGQALGVRESWPGAGLMTSEPKPRIRSLTPPSWGKPIRTTNQPQPLMTASVPPPTLSQNPLLPTAPHPHWSVPVRGRGPCGRGSEATMMSLLLLCHRCHQSLFYLCLLPVCGPPV